MSASFLLTLDRQTSLAVEFEAGPEPNTILIKLAADADVVDAKLWGAIDPTDPGNADYSETEGGANWFPFSGELLVKVGPGDGQKVFHVQVRDDVWNESTIETVKFGVAPEEQVAPVPGWPTPPKPRRRKSRDGRRRIESRSVIRTSFSATLFKARRRAESRSTVSVRTLLTLRRGLAITSTSFIAVGSRATVRARAVPDPIVTAVISEFTIVKRRGRADDDAVAMLLLT